MSVSKNTTLAALLATSTLLCLPCIATVFVGGCSAGPDPLFFDAGSGEFGVLPDIATCLPNNDGVIDRDEVAFVTGLPISYRVNSPGTIVGVNVAGVQASATREWDFSALDGATFSVGLETVKSQWFAPLFPSASHAVAGDSGGKLLQVIQVDGARVLLLGLVSRQPDHTRLVYETPILFLRFPLRVGDRYTTTSKAPNGKLAGLPIATEDTYRIRVDAEGTVRLPFLALSRSLRVRVDLTTRAVGGVERKVKQAQWFHECYGEVARIVSRDGETADDFVEATEFRRLSF